MAALLHGFATFDHSVRIAGVILNRVGTATPRAGAAAGLRTDRCTRARRDPAGRRVVRSVKASRPGDGGRARQAARDDAVDAMTELVARHVDLAAVVAAADSHVADAAWDPAVAEHAADEVVVALAGGQGVQLRLPRARRTAARRRRRRRRVRSADRAAARRRPRHWCCPAASPSSSPPSCPPTTLRASRFGELAASGAPIHAECAGLTYLVDDLDGIPDVRRAVRVGPVHRPAHAGIPRRRRDGRLLAARGGHSRRRPRIPPHRRDVPARLRAGVAVRPRIRGRRGRRRRARRGARRRICTPTPPRIRRRRPASWPRRQPLSSPGERERLPRRPAPDRPESRRGRRRHRRPASVAPAAGQRRRRARHRPGGHPAVEAMAGITLRTARLPRRRSRRRLVRDRRDQRSGRERRRRRRGRTPAHLLRAGRHRPRRHRRHARIVRVRRPVGRRARRRRAPPLGGHPDGDPRGAAERRDHRRGARAECAAPWPWSAAAPATPS